MAIAQRDPERGRDYELYRPSAYDRASAWPLVVVCAGGLFDSPSGQISTWKALAESRGFLVAAPRVSGLSCGLSPDPSDWARTLRDNEAHILATVKHIRAGHTISPDRIFLYGWSDGAVTALFAGGRNADTFRAVSAVQPDYAEGMLDELIGRIDSYQPVQLRYATNDAITGKTGRSCEAWLRAHGVDVRVHKIGAVARKEVGPSVDFFEKAILDEPFVRITAASEGTSPLARRFEISSVQMPVKYLWEFGDGDASPVAKPVHVYPAPGTYRVRALLELPQRVRVERTLDVKVP